MKGFSTELQNSSRHHAIMQFLYESKIAFTFKRISIGTKDKVQMLNVKGKIFNFVFLLRVNRTWINATTLTAPTSFSFFAAFFFP